MPSSGRWSIAINTGPLEGLIRNIPVRSRAQVDETAQDIRSRANQMAPRDTGSLAESIYVTNGDQSDYASRAGTARSLNPGVRILEEIHPDFVLSLFGNNDGAYIAVVGVAAGHGIFQELGTRFQPPQPFMTPAVEPARDAFRTGMARVADT